MATIVLLCSSEDRFMEVIVSFCHVGPGLELSHQARWLESFFDEPSYQPYTDKCYVVCMSFYHK